MIKIGFFRKKSREERLSELHQKIKTQSQVAAQRAEERRIEDKIRERKQTLNKLKEISKTPQRKRFDSFVTTFKEQTKKEATNIGLRIVEQQKKRIAEERKSRNKPMQSGFKSWRDV